MRVRCWMRCPNQLLFGWYSTGASNVHTLLHEKKTKLCMHRGNEILLTSQLGGLRKGTWL
jgi:hypothetical protein